MKPGIYAITSPSGKRYVGSAVSFAGRWSAHRYRLRRGTHHCSGLQNAFNKYGEGALTFLKLIICAPADLLMYEQAAIDSTPRHKLYNRLMVAGSLLGFKHSDEAKAKMSADRRGMNRPPQTPEHVQNNADARRGNKLSAQTRANQSAAHAVRHKATSASGYAYVSRLGAGWGAKVRINRQRVYLGYYATPELAHAAVQAAIKESP